MLPERPIEVDHHGHALAAHRENLGVDLAEMIAGADAPDNAMVGKIETTRRLQVDHIEIHHRALIKAWGAGSVKASVIFAMREQWYTTPADWALWRQASKAKPTVAWWWGSRRDLTPGGAYCYVCDAVMHSYDVSRGLTRRGRLVIMQHRYGHMITLMTLKNTTETESYL